MKVETPLPSWPSHDSGVSWLAPSSTASSAPSSPSGLRRPRAWLSRPKTSYTPTGQGWVHSSSLKQSSRASVFITKASAWRATEATRAALLLRLSHHQAHRPVQATCTWHQAPCLVGHQSVECRPGCQLGCPYSGNSPLCDLSHV